MNLRSGSSGSFEFRPSQSISATVVDLASIAAVVYLAKIGVREPVVWSILSGLIVGRFGVAHGKTLERSNSNSNRGGGGDQGSGPPPPRSGSRTEWPAVTEERDPRSFPRKDPRRDDVAPEGDGSEPSVVGGVAHSIAEESPVAFLERRATRPSARTRLSAWISDRSPGRTLSWWARPSIPLPRMNTHLDLMSLAVLVVLFVTLAATVAGAEATHGSRPSAAAVR